MYKRSQKSTYLAHFFSNYTDEVDLSLISSYNMARLRRKEMRIIEGFLNYAWFSKMYKRSLKIHYLAHFFSWKLWKWPVTM